jgi:ammonia channel protein AmtB
MTKYKYDDACDVFGVHGMGGIVGCIMTGIFADKDVVTMSGDDTINGGWLNRNVNSVFFYPSFRISKKFFIRNFYRLSDCIYFMTLNNPILQHVLIRQSK